MAAEIHFQASVVVNSVDLSSRCQEARFSRQTDAIDASASGDLAHVMLAGLEAASLSCRFVQDFAVGSVHRTLNPLVSSNGFTVVYKKDKTAATSATNPSYTFTAILEGYNPIEASQGSLVTVSVTFRAAGDVTRAEA